VTGAEADRTSFRQGVRQGLPFGAVGFVISLSFGVLATDAGFSPGQAIAIAGLVFAGSAQFASLTVVAGGGGIPAALAAATLMNSRFLAMGIALAPSLPGGPVARAAQGQTVVDSSWALASRGDGTFDRWRLFGTTLPQYVAWLAGTVVGAYAGDLVGDPERWGLDALFPVFFVAILIAELKRPGARAVALAGAVIALALVPWTPPGIPILAASVAALLGLVAPGPGSDRGPDVEELR
jgi:predicted branched-subunit amino acid permease